MNYLGPCSVNPLVKGTDGVMVGIQYQRRQVRGRVAKGARGSAFHGSFQRHVSSA